MAPKCSRGRSPNGRSSATPPPSNVFGPLSPVAQPPALGVAGKQAAVVGLYVIAPQQQLRDFIRDTTTTRPDVESPPALVPVHPHTPGVRLAQSVQRLFQAELGGFGHAHLCSSLRSWPLSGYTALARDCLSPS